MFRLAYVSLAALALASCASSPRGADESSTWQQRSDRTDRYIVVTVRNDPTSIEVRAGSSGRDYGGRGTYGAAPRARTDVKELSAKYSLSYVNAWPIEVLQVHCVVYGIGAGADINEVMTRLRSDPRVESVQPLQSFSSMVDTQQSPSAISYANLQPNLQRLQILEAHRVTRGAGVRVAVIDTGVDASHPDLKGRVVTQRDLVGNIAAASESKSNFAERHGTAVAGVIAALADVRQGIVGVAPAATVLALRACWPAQAGDARAVCNTFTIAQALSAAIELRADVVNLSLAGPDDPLLSRLVTAGSDRGMLYVGAMPPSGTAIGFPASVPAVIRADVATANSISNGNAMRAPGTDILTLRPAGQYDLQSGSSLSTASISGAVALLMARNRKLNREAVTTALSRSMSARAPGETSVDLCAALSYVDKTVVCDRE